MNTRDPDRRRAPGTWTATALVVGHTIGVGVFLTPAEIIGALASPALTLALWLGCGVLVLAGALTFGELAARFPQAGGLYIYLREAWGRRVAFLYGWQCLLIMDPGITASLALGVSQYLVVVYPAAAGRERWVALAMVWMLALVTMAGLRLNARILNWMTAAKVAAFAGVVGAAFLFGAGHWSHFEPLVTRRTGAPPLAGALALGLVGVFYSFGGFWEVSRIAGELRDPRRELPRGLVFGVTAITAIYLATTLAFIYLVPPEETTSATVFAQRAGEALFGRAGALVLALVVMLSVTASALALFIMAPRVYLAMSRDRLFPGALAALHPATGAPVRATTLLAVIASLFVLTGSFAQVVAFFIGTTMVFVALAAAGLFVLRRRQPAPAGFRTPGFPVTPALFILLGLPVIGLIAVSRPLQTLAGVAIILLGLPVHRLLEARHVARGERPPG